MNKKTILTSLGVLVLMVVISSAYMVDETEYVVVTRFDKIQRVNITPGLKFRVPFIEEPVPFPKNLQEWEGSADQINTLDKTYILVNAFARWKIVDPELFFKATGNQPTLARAMNQARQRLDEIIDPTVRNFITSNRLIEAVRNSNRELDTFEDLGGGTSVQQQLAEDAAIHDPATRFAQVMVGREKIDREILNQAKPKLKEFGIQLVDVKIKRVNYIEAVRKSVYDRMIAERKQIAQKFRSEGKGEAQKILGEKERDLKRIESEAYRSAQEIMGKADAQATQLYASAFGRDPEFYSFIKTLEVYNTSLSGNSALILSTDSDLLRYLKGYDDK
ncbi:protease modulator HflC [Desulfosarcina sp. OttesenSCG-928-A07]|nr:protease modulator HflC [Desulfosarcina sp. OttesenSCG-928-G17]MDL2328713.1 protease modulator HflC [Desulfosarcina sp. OttesenSCG-928-A07]